MGTLSQSHDDIFPIAVQKYLMKVMIKLTNSQILNAICLTIQQAPRYCY